MEPVSGASGIGSVRLAIYLSLQEQRDVAAGGCWVLLDDCGPVRMAGQYGWLQ